ncbi:hypothetical protein EIP86_008297 [Pleurotus ostreatoroseus]|nr:hypothetical protein EIP86_008297 [Pleurotus ostreatoroseus]
MKFATFVAVSAAIVGSRAQFQINTPGTEVQCVPTQFTFSGGSGVIQTPDANGAIEQEIDNIQSSPISWSTNITGSIQLGLTLRDSTGASAQSGVFTVQAGSDSSCLTTSGGATDSSSASATDSSTDSSAASSTDSSTGSETSSAATGSSSSTAPASSQTGSSAANSGSSSSHASSTGSAASGSSHSGSSTASSAATSASATTSSSAGMINAASSGLVGFIGFLLASIMA